MTRVSYRTSARDRIVDVTCLTLAALVAALVLMDLTVRGTTPGYLGLAAGLAVPGCALLWWRRRWPVGVAVVLLAPAAVTESVGGAAIIAIFTVAVHRAGRVALAVAAAHLLIVVPYSLVRPDPDLNLVEYHAVNLLLLGAVLTWGWRIRTRRELLRALRERAARAEAEAVAHADRLRALERERIAREMHDALAHRISLVCLHAGALEVRPDLPAEAVARTAGTIRTSAHQALEELREILAVLRAGGDETGLGPQPGLADVRRLIDEARSAGTVLHLDWRLPTEPAPPATVGRTTYRVVQEGLTNARKHAPGARVRLGLDRTAAGELHLWLHNPLPGGDPRRADTGPRRADTEPPDAYPRGAEPPVGESARMGMARIPGSGSGLVGLVERVSLAGGRVEHGARRAADGAITFRLEVWLPWPA